MEFGSLHVRLPYVGRRLCAKYYSWGLSGWNKGLSIRFAKRAIFFAQAFAGVFWGTEFILANFVHQSVHGQILCTRLGLVFEKKKAAKSLKLNGFLCVVPGAGIEPAHLSVGDFESLCEVLCLGKRCEAERRLGKEKVITDQ